MILPWYSNLNNVTVVNIFFLNLSALRLTFLLTFSYCHCKMEGLISDMSHYHASLEVLSDTQYQVSLFCSRPGPLSILSVSNVWIGGKRGDRWTLLFISTTLLHQIIGLLPKHYLHLIGKVVARIKSCP